VANPAEPVATTTSVVPTKPEEPQKPELEYANYFNMKYGYSVIYPKALLFPEKENPLGNTFKSLDGKVALSVMGVDNPGGEITAASGYKDATDIYTKHAPVTILDQRLESNGFEFKTKNGSRIGRSKVVVTSSYFRTLSMEYDDAESAVYEPVWTRIATQFAR